MDLYREEILDHYKHPRNFGELPDADVQVKEANSSCGDMLEVSLKFRNGKGEKLIQKIKFKGLGCAISIAATSMLTEFLKGKTLEEAGKLKLEDVYKLLGGPVSPGRVKCVSLPLKAIDRAVKKYSQEEHVR